jgi:thiol-disulfide isomerase/thioredoxin
MRKLSFLFLLNFMIVSALCAQKISHVKMADIESRLLHSDTLFVVNFWATWCGPCVAELPEFNRIDSAWKGKPVRVLLVSLDFPDAWPGKLTEFLKKKQIHPEVYWLDESDANSFIPKISANWSGAIPATLFSFKAKNIKDFKEGKVNYEFLNEKIWAGLKN